MKKTIPLAPFYFIRHGQTDWNLKEVWQGWTDIPLNETGHDQARSAVSILSEKGISRIVTSPLVRAHKTAEIINEHLRVPVRVVEGLKECSLGILEGTVKDKAIMSIDLHHVALIGKGEHPDEFKARIAGALHDVLDPEHTTLIVAHGGVYWAIMDMIGFKEERSHNCVPYLFMPPAENQSTWTVHPLDISPKI
ncbi:MAG TPA: histidine phosphatase family protein [Candidatus Babeliales bacterium]|nr:histidine phosphatase family protein [Candidatus Babeliales bacterium]